jgi:hypothetical protein
VNAFNTCEDHVIDVDREYVNGVCSLMKVVRTSVFLRCLKKLNATNAEIDALEAMIVANPSAGDVIPELGVSERYGSPWAVKVNGAVAGQSIFC